MLLAVCASAIPSDRFRDSFDATAKKHRELFDESVRKGHETTFILFGCFCAFAVAMCILVAILRHRYPDSFPEPVGYSTPEPVGYSTPEPKPVVFTVTITPNGSQ